MKKRYWFKRRRYGWGWTPVTWQGWSVVGAYLLIVLGGSYYLNTQSPEVVPLNHAWFITSVAIATLILVHLSYRFGPPPKWRWGVSINDDPKEDY